MNSMDNAPLRSAGSSLRRDFLKLPLAAGAVQALTAVQAVNAAPRTDEYAPDNLKIASMLNVATATDDDMLFFKQIGLRWVHAQFGDNAPYELIKSTQERLARYGIKIHCGLMNAYRSTRIQLGLPGRDEDLAKFQTFITDLGRCGIPVAHNDFHPGNTYTTEMIDSPRGYRVRQFDLDDFRKKVEKQKFDRVYTAEDMWANYTYYLKAILPVAEKANVKMALHPDDPPLAMMNGVAKLFINYDGYRKGEQISGGSKSWGLCLCVGTWLEGGANMGKDVFGVIQDFCSRDKIYSIHFRNVSSPMPRFHETFHDDGYGDMFQIMKSLRVAKFTGSLIPDHYPGMVNDKGHRLADAYCVAYMRSLLRRVNEEVG